ncbi:sensor histidine kinase [Pedobacter sp. MC2016-24]|uniref:sensor histidine kinase n=1 Tax=Pedobacter sp. MC2016-24 TaxID=2780090 RepID=UPI001882E9A9|nr:histidine kinase [Pedobacter sp. MC2016-24]MBE9597749.1 histidine kinase [Pedobacter sp. MC2016-24]
MSKNIVLLLLICAVCQSVSGRQKRKDQYLDHGFSNISLKKRVVGKICDSCQVDFAVDAEPDFSYVMTGSGFTPERFCCGRNDNNPALGTYSNAKHLISKGLIGITFLPNFLMGKGKRVQYFRSYGGADYRKLEFSVKQNGRTIKSWGPILELKEDKNYSIGMPSFHAGTFNLRINDTLEITVRAIETKKIVKTITVIRAEDKATNFVFYELPMGSEDFSINLQNILNINSGIPEVEQGRTSNIFEKDYGTIGILRFGPLGNDELQYTFEKSRDQWKSIKGLNAENSAYIVFSAELPEGKVQDIYLRYSSQPETVHKITMSVKQKPFQMPWKKVAVISMFAVAVCGLWFYLWGKRNRARLAKLKRKSEDAEAQLMLLSGQLNPHFLFNSLNAIQGTFNSRDPERANAYIGNVAGFMRNVMNNGRKEFISLHEELALETDYLKLEQERMDFSYSIDIAPEIQTSTIDFPPLLLQPVLENSIRHAFNRDFASPLIQIRVFSYGTTLYVDIADNGKASWDSTTVHEGHGLSLIRKRMAVYNDKLETMPIDIQVNYKEGTGTMTRFTFQNWLS